MSTSTYTQSSSTHNQGGQNNQNGQMIKPTHETSLPFYVIYSKWSFDEINEFLRGYTEHPDVDIGTLKTDFDNNGRDTYRTFVLLTDRIVSNLTKDGLNKSYRDGNKSGFSFAKFRIRDDFNLVNKSLCIPIPRQLGAKGREVKAMIQSKLDEAISFDIITEDQYSINVNLFDRETDQPASNAFISFDPIVTDETIAVIKALVHNTYWPTESQTNQFILNCRFALSSDREKKERRDHKDYKERKDYGGHKRDHRGYEVKTFYKHEGKTEKQNGGFKPV